MSEKKSKDQIFREKVESIPTDELIELAHEQLSKMCKTGGRSFTMTIPCQTDDSDIVYSEVLRRLKNSN